MKNDPLELLFFVALAVAFLRTVRRMRTPMNKPKEPNEITFMAGLLLVFVTYLSLDPIIGRFPSIVAPSSMLLLLPGILGVPIPILSLVPTMLFWLWSQQLFRGSPDLNRRTKILGCIISVLSATYYFNEWRWNAHYYGMFHTVVCTLVSATFAVVISIAAWKNKNKPSFKTSIVTTWLIFAWIFTFAFPWLGELP